MIVIIQLILCKPCLTVLILSKFLKLTSAFRKIEMQSILLAHKLERELHLSSCDSTFPHRILTPLFLRYDLSLAPPGPKPACRVASVHLNSPSRRPRATRRMTEFPQPKQNTILSKCSSEQQNKGSLASYRQVQCLAYLHLPPAPAITLDPSTALCSFPLGFLQVSSVSPKIVLSFHSIFLLSCPLSCL